MLQQLLLRLLAALQLVRQLMPKAASLALLLEGPSQERMQAAQQQLPLLAPLLQLLETWQQQASRACGIASLPPCLLALLHLPLHQLPPFLGCIQQKDGQAAPASTRQVSLSVGEA